jgi:K+-transporting ATPase c subunit
MFAQLRPALMMIMLFTALTGFAYPLAITGIAQLVFPDKANGSIIERDGKAACSALIGHSSKRIQRWLGLIGEPRVNVLLLNIALDVLK